MIQNYWFDNQFRAYLLQFVAIFYGLKVQTGIGECDVPEFISVPVVMGNKDRVVAAIAAGNTTNRVFSLPAMAVYMTSIEQALDRIRAPGYIDQRVRLPVGGVFPDDLRTVKRVMPVPYNITIELSIWASNTQQMHQILEQILVLFNPDLQIQKSDSEYDWTRITRVELTGISDEENYPTGTDRRAVVKSLSFMIPIYLSIPMAVKDDLVRRVLIQISNLNSMVVNEVDENGDIRPFTEVLGTVDIDTRPAALREPNTTRDMKPLEGPVPYEPAKLEIPGPNT